MNFVQIADVEAALTNAKLNREQRSGLLRRFGVDRVEEVPSARFHEFMSAISAAAERPIWTPPKGAA